jgi:ribose transport system permease protein
MQSMGDTGWGTAFVGIIVSVSCGLGWGLLNGVLIAKAKVPPLIVTLGTLGGALGLAQVITGGVDIREVPAVLQDTIGYGNVPGTTLPTISLIAMVLIVIFGIVLHRTRFGLYTFAIGSNEESARRVGVKVDRQLISIYALSGALAGVAGILSLAQYGTTAIAGQSATNLNVIAAVVIGGTSLFGGVGTIFGTVVGLFIPAVLQNGFVIVGVQPFWQQVAVGAVLVAAVYVDQRRRAAAARGHSAKDEGKKWLFGRRSN